MWQPVAAVLLHLLQQVPAVMPQDDQTRTSVRQSSCGPMPAAKALGKPEGPNLELLKQANTPGLPSINDLANIICPLGALDEHNATAQHNGTGSAMPPASAAVSTPRATPTVTVSQQVLTTPVLHSSQHLAVSVGPLPATSPPSPSQAAAVVAAYYTASPPPAASSSRPHMQTSSHLSPSVAVKSSGQSSTSCSPLRSSIKAALPAVQSTLSTSLSKLAGVLGRIGRSTTVTREPAAAPTCVATSATPAELPQEPLASVATTNTNSTAEAAVLPPPPLPPRAGVAANGSGSALSSTANPQWVTSARMSSSGSLPGTSTVGWPPTHTRQAAMATKLWSCRTTSTPGKQTASSGAARSSNDATLVEPTTLAAPTTAGTAAYLNPASAQAVPAASPGNTAALAPEPTKDASRMGRLVEAQVKVAGLCSELYMSFEDLSNELGAEELDQLDIATNLALDQLVCMAEQPEFPAALAANIKIVRLVLLLPSAVAQLSNVKVRLTQLIVIAAAAASKGHNNELATLRVITALVDVLGKAGLKAHIHVLGALSHLLLDAADTAISAFIDAGGIEAVVPFLIPPPVDLDMVEQWWPIVHRAAALLLVVGRRLPDSHRQQHSRTLSTVVSTMVKMHADVYPQSVVATFALLQGHLAQSVAAVSELSSANTEVAANSAACTGPPLSEPAQLSSRPAKQPSRLLEGQPPGQPQQFSATRQRLQQKLRRKQQAASAGLGLMKPEDSCMDPSSIRVAEPACDLGAGAPAATSDLAEVDSCNQPTQVQQLSATRHGLQEKLSRKKLAEPAGRSPATAEDPSSETSNTPTSARAVALDAENPAASSDRELSNHGEAATAIRKKHKKRGKHGKAAAAAVDAAGLLPPSSMTSQAPASPGLADLGNAHLGPAADAYEAAADIAFSSRRISMSDEVDGVGDDTTPCGSFAGISRFSSRFSSSNPFAVLASKSMTSRCQLPSNLELKHEALSSCLTAAAPVAPSAAAAKPPAAPSSSNACVTARRKKLRGNIVGKQQSQAAGSAVYAKTTNDYGTNSAPAQKSLPTVGRPAMLKKVNKIAADAAAVAAAVASPAAGGHNSSENAKEIAMKAQQLADACKVEPKENKKKTAARVLVAQLEASVDDDRDKLYCVVCMDAVRTVLLLPCRHLVLCEGCAKDYEGTDSSKASKPLCPMCRVPVEEQLSVYVV